MALIGDKLAQKKNNGIHRKMIAISLERLAHGASKDLCDQLRTSAYLSYMPPRLEVQADHHKCQLQM